VYKNLCGLIYLSHVFGTHRVSHLSEKHKVIWLWKNTSDMRNEIFRTILYNIINKLWILEFIFLSGTIVRALNKVGYLGWLQLRDEIQVNTNFESFSNLFQMFGNIEVAKSSNVRNNVIFRLLLIQYTIILYTETQLTCVYFMHLSN